MPALLCPDKSEGRTCNTVLVKGVLGADNEGTCAFGHGTFQFPYNDSGSMGQPVLLRRPRVSRIDLPKPPEPRPYQPGYRSAAFQAAQRAKRQAALK